MALNLGNNLFEKNNQNLIDIGRRLEYYHISGIDFQAVNPDTDQYRLLGNSLVSEQTNLRIWAPIHLPEGSEIIAAVAFGDDTTDTWELFRSNTVTNDNDSVADGVINTESVDISSFAQAHIVDGSKHTYSMEIKIGDIDDGIGGARIKYLTKE